MNILKQKVEEGGDDNRLVAIAQQNEWCRVVVENVGRKGDYGVERNEEKATYDIFGIVLVPLPLRTSRSLTALLSLL